MAQTFSSRMDVIKAINSRRDEGLPLAWMWVKRIDPSLLIAANEYCGSWKQAILDSGYTLSVTHSSLIGNVPQKKH